MSTDADAWRDPSAWSGWVVFAGIVLFTIGCINIIQGLAALLKNEIYINGENGLLVATDFDAWGWSLIFWGAVMILVGIGLFSGKEWARWVAIIAIVVNLIGQFAWFPAFPLWSLIVIALDIAVLYALTARWHEAKADLTAGR